MKTLTIKQPWASLIIEGGKDIENRTRRTHVRGWVLVHTGLRMDPPGMVLDFCEDFGVLDASAEAARMARDVLLRASHACGGIIGAMHISDCVEDSDSPWFCGPFGYVIDKVIPLPFVACRGHLGWFDFELPEHAAKVFREATA